MYFKSFRYFTRPALRAAHSEARAAGIPLRYAHPPFNDLPKKAKIVIKMAYPFHRGNGDGVPQMHCFLMWVEGGMAWHMDITMDRYKQLPKFSTENPHVYAF